MRPREHRLNIRCSEQLYRAVKEAADKSGVSMTKQVEITLERAYEVEPMGIWLPPILSGERSPEL